MTADRLPRRVQEFLAAYITSIAQLELLLLLRTTAPRAWTCRELVQELRVETVWTQDQLSRLEGHGLLEHSPEGDTYRYAATGELAEGAADVAQAYLAHRVSVTETIYSRPDAAVRALADAFKMRRGSTNGS